jgi:hypothetical protein
MNEVLMLMNLNPNENGWSCRIVTLIKSSLTQRTSCVAGS